MNNPFANSHNDVLSGVQHVGRELEEAAAMAKASSLGLPFVDLRSFPTDIVALGVFSAREAEQAEAVPFYLNGKELRLGTTNPENVYLFEQVKKLSGHYKVVIYFLSHDSLVYGLSLYKKVVTPEKPNDETIRLDLGDSPEDLLKKINSGGANLSAGEIMSGLLGAAFALGASDVHLEPGGERVEARFRIDGVLQSLASFEVSLYNEVLSRIKLVSRLKLNVINVPQDGRFTFFAGKEAVDVRVSTLPSTYKEAVVMRLLGVGAFGLKLENLGLIGKSRKVIEDELQKPNGFIITTGPTGSGKTTTLYAFLNELNDPGVKIITIEDPVEYKLAGVQQTPVDHNVNFSFAEALRAILRQDPDIVMVGEIRDTETAETALQASLTGHMVLSTLHTNDSFGAVPRLVSMGAKPYIISPALNAVIAQRLVRRLCVNCKSEIVLEGSLMEKVNRVIAGVPPAAEVSLPSPLRFYHSKGCNECHNLGYKGRIGIYEVIHINDAMKDLILKGASMLEMKKQAILDGTLTMAQDGILKALEGITDVEEVFRVARE